VPKIIAKGIGSLSALHLYSCLPSPPGGSACSKQNQEVHSCRDAWSGRGWKTHRLVPLSVRLGSYRPSPREHSFRASI